MLLVCRLAGLSALEAHYAGIDASTQTIRPLHAPSLQEASRRLRTSPSPIAPMRVEDGSRAS
jgi:hypothetical protein